MIRSSPPRIPDPLFVNRTAELAEFTALLDDLERGHRRHLALLGLRRIGKTVLLDEVRRRHPESAIAYVALDEVVSTPEDFARALVYEVLRAVTTVTRVAPPEGQSNDPLRQAAHLLGRPVVAALDDVLAPLAAQGPLTSYGALLVATMRFPSTVADTTNCPVVVMLDEFQEITRLQAFPGSENLLGALRAALDRPASVAYVVAGSRVTVLRKLLGDGDNPLFTRFEQLEFRPFVFDATEELTTYLWSEDALSVDPDSTTRLHKLTGGWPFYIHAVATRARQMARAADGRITDDIVGLAFREELIGRAAALGQYCRYLLDAALRTDANGPRNTLDAVLRQVARWQPLTRTSLERRLRRHHAHTAVHTAVNRLIDADFVREEAGTLNLLDPVFALWLNLEEVRRDPAAALSNPPALRRLLAWYEAQHQRDRQEMGVLFERRIENLVRQFRGQMVDGKLFNTSEPLRLPAVRQAGKLRYDDPQGRYGDRPDTYEIDVATTGDGPEDSWAVEAKHRQGAITVGMVDRFLRSAEAIEKAYNVRFAHRWIVAPRGVRGDALDRLRSAGAYSSGLRHIERLERMVAEPGAPGTDERHDSAASELPTDEAGGTIQGHTQS